MHEHRMAAWSIYAMPRAFVYNTALLGGIIYVDQQAQPKPDQLQHSMRLCRVDESSIHGPSFPCGMRFEKLTLSQVFLKMCFFKLNFLGKNFELQAGLKPETFWFASQVNCFKLSWTWGGQSIFKDMPHTWNLSIKTRPVIDPARLHPYLLVVDSFNYSLQIFNEPWIAPINW